MKKACELRTGCWLMLARDQRQTPGLVAVREYVFSRPLPCPRGPVPQAATTSGVLS